MRRRFFALVMLVGALCWRAAGPLAQNGMLVPWDEEFVGPFGSWADVKAVFGARGDGASDDTAAFQAAFEALGAHGRSPVLYIPAGIYRITGTITLTSRIHISVIGEDPARTVLRWGGVRDGVMLRVQNVAYSRFARLTFDGGGTTAVLVDQAWDCQHDHFDTGNEYADDVFREAGIGLRGGNNGCGFAETSVWRSRFSDLTTGIALKNFNALDLWVWYSRFDRCAVGVTNDPGAGNYHVYNSVFRDSTVSDLYMRNTGGFNIRNNTSIGSKAFFTTPSNFWFPAPVTLQGNAVQTTSDTPIAIGNHGPVLLVDNVIDSAPSAPAMSVGYDMFLTDGDALVVGNATTSKIPAVVTGRSRMFDNLSAQRLRVMPPELPATPARSSRRILEVPVGATAAVVQQALTTASRPGAGSVVHLPAGEFQIDTTLVIPAGADVEVIGDGPTSVLKWTGSGAGPVLRLNGPTRALLRDLEVAATPAVDAIAIRGADQPGSRLFLNQVQLVRGDVANLLADGLDYLVIDARDIGHGPSAGGSISLVGGPQARAGRPQTASVNVFSGASCCNTGSAYSVFGGGRLLLRDIWYEFRTAGAPYLRASGPSHLVVSGVRVAQPSSLPAFEFSDFHGTATLLESSIDAPIRFSGDARGARVFGSGLVTAPGVASFVIDAASPSPQWAFEHLRKATPAGSSVSLPDRGTATNVWVRQMLADARREQPRAIGPLPPGVTDIRLYRVWTSVAAVGVHVTP